MKSRILVLSLIIGVAAAGCGGSNSSGSRFTATGSSASYNVELTSAIDPVVGKTPFSVKVTRKDTGAAALGLAVTLAPVMDMSGMRSVMAMGMSHGTPVENVSDNADGSYARVVYFLMAGKWTMNVKIGAETASMPMTVAAAAKDTAMAALRAQKDMIMGITGSMEARPYYIFNEGMEATDTLALYASARENMFTYWPVQAGQPIGSSTIGDFTFETSQDGVNWRQMINRGNGHFHANGLTGISKGIQGTVFVRLAVNGVQCTTNGMAPEGSNAMQTFKVTP